MKSVAYIGFGSNLGDREAVFRQAVGALDEIPGITVTRASSLYETEPVGLSDGGASFLNAAIELETDLSAPDLLRAIRGIENRLGKSPDHRSDLSRAIDLDILLFGDTSVNSDALDIPHPRMHSRGFVLVPLAQIAPDAEHPGLRCTVKDLLGTLPGPELSGVRLWDGTRERETKCG